MGDVIIGDARLKQPNSDDYHITNQNCLSTIMPPQDLDLILDIHNNGWELSVQLHRSVELQCEQPKVNKFPLIVEYLPCDGPACKLCYLQKFNNTRIELGQAKPNKKRRIKGKIVSESKYQKKDPEIEFYPDDNDGADNDIPEDLSMPKNNE